MDNLVMKKHQVESIIITVSKDNLIEKKYMEDGEYFSIDEIELTFFIKHELEPFNDDDLKEFQKWLYNGTGYYLGVYGHGDEVWKNPKYKSSITTFVNNERELCSHELDRGTYRFISTLIQVWYFLKKEDSKYSDTLYIKNPEAFLHPNMVAKFTDMIISISEELKLREKKILIYTHSSTLISRVGISIILNEIQASDIKIIIIKEGLNKVDCVFNEDGDLINWEMGFLNPDIKRSTPRTHNG